MPSSRAHEALAAGLRLEDLVVARRRRGSPRAGRRCGSPSPDATVPSFTHWLRMSSWRRSVTSAVGSSVGSAPITARPYCGGRARAAPRTRPRCRRRAPRDRGLDSAVADQAEVQLPAVREDRNVEREVPRQRHDRVHLEHLARRAVERHLRARDVRDDEVGEPLPCAARAARPSSVGRGVLATSPSSAAAPTACSRSLRSAVLARTASRRARGSGSPTASGTIIVEMRLPSFMRCVVVAHRHRAERP